MNTIRVVLFDHGDTLVHVVESAADVWQRFVNDLAAKEVALSDVQRALSEADLASRSQVSMFRGRLDEYWLWYDEMVLLNLGFSQLDADELALKIQKAFESHEWTFVSFPETRFVLSALLERGYRLGIISDNDERLPLRLADLQLDSYFESVTYSEEVGTTKPDPHIFRVALERMKCAPHEAVYVGDRHDRDVAGARAAGITPVLIDRDSRYPDADCLRIEHLRELLAVLGSNE